MRGERSAEGPWSGAQTLPALEMEGGRAVVTTQEVSPFLAAIAAVVVGGPAASPRLLLGLATPLFRLIRLGGSQQSLDLLHTHTNGVCAHAELPGAPRPPRHAFAVTQPSPPFCPSASHPGCSQNLSAPPEPGDAHPSRVPAAQHSSFFQMGRLRTGGWGGGCAVPFSPLPCMDSGGLQSLARERPEARCPDVQGEAQRGRREGGGETRRCKEMEWAGASGKRIEGGGSVKTAANVLQG